MHRPSHYKAANIPRAYLRHHRFTSVVPYMVYSSEFKILIINQDMDLSGTFGIINAEASNNPKGMKQDDCIF